MIRSSLFEREVELAGDSIEQKQSLSPRCIDFRPFDLLNGGVLTYRGGRVRRKGSYGNSWHSTETESINSTEYTVVPDAKSIVVHVGTLEAFQRG